MEAVDKLKLSLQEKNPSLLIGAGFSYGAINANGEKLPLGKRLVELIYNRMFVENPPDKKMLEEDEPGAKKYLKQQDLKGLCGLLRDENRVEERNEYLTDIFTGATIDLESSLFNITNYKWNRIFTLNIDCLLEYIYDKKGIPVNVWNKDNDDRRNNTSDTLIIKLHGCVNNKKEGYIFDEKEYIDFWNEDNCFLRDFGDTYSKGDMIFIGTEFQEEDLKTIIGKYDSKGYDLKGHDYFFIAPQIGDVRLKRQIFSTDNFHWIQWTAEQFSDFLKENVLVEKSIKKDLSERGLLSIDDLFSQKQQDYESKLYAGYESKYDDFFYDWDIVRPGIENFEKRLMKSDRNIVGAVIGNSYVGKTCVAKRVLIDLRSKGYLTFQFSMRSSEYMQLFLQYMNHMPLNTKVAVLFEEASYYYNLIYLYLIKKCPNNIEQLIVLTSETRDNHFVKKDILKSSNSIEVFNVDEKISWNYAVVIYNKLKAKHWLSKPEICGSDMNSVKVYAHQINDIIEFLYNISHGHGFEKHYLDMFDMVQKDVNYKYLQAVTILQILGLGSVPKRIFSTLLKDDRNHLDYNSFVNEFNEVLDIKEGRIKVRCLRLIHNAITCNMDQNEIKKILYEIIRQTTGQFNEGDVNEWSEIFQKALTVKRILKEKILSLSTIRELLNEVERYGEKYSFYWIQRGIASQKDGEYDLADHYFREGIRLRPVSYQARHALAKNLMERAIEQIKNGDTSYAPYYMDEGRGEIKKIIDDPAYSRGYKYSLHALIDMSIKYSNQSVIKIDVEDIKYMSEKILDLSQDDVDSYIIDLIKKYINYCDMNGMSKYCQKIINKHFEKLSDIKLGEAKDYLTENLDWEY
jgi:hypothetical protein